ncbi:hypothetical protein [Nocardioides ferulae]|nr:hypothetical protein [Nocardioides ferulae]
MVQHGPLVGELEEVGLGVADRVRAGGGGVEDLVIDISSTASIMGLVDQ